MTLLKLELGKKDLVKASNVSHDTKNFWLEAEHLFGSANEWKTAPAFLIKKRNET